MGACVWVRAARVRVGECNHAVFLFPITALIHQLLVAMAFPLSAQSKAKRREDNHVTTSTAAFDTRARGYRKWQFLEKRKLRRRREKELMGTGDARNYVHCAQTH